MSDTPGPVPPEQSESIQRRTRAGRNNRYAIYLDETLAGFADYRPTPAVRGAHSCTLRSHQTFGGRGLAGTLVSSSASRTPAMQDFESCRTARSSSAWLKKHHEVRRVRRLAERVSRAIRVSAVVIRDPEGRVLERAQARHIDAHASGRKARAGRGSAGHRRSRVPRGARRRARTRCGCAASASFARQPQTNRHAMWSRTSSSTRTSLSIGRSLRSSTSSGRIRPQPLPRWHH